MGFRVGDKYRKNTLANVPGGVTVVVQLEDGKRLEYEKVQYPDSYIRKVLQNPDVVDAWVK